MDSNSTEQEILHDVFPYLKVYKDGTVERIAGTETVPPQHDPITGVTSKDRLILPESGVSARFYKPNDHVTNNMKKLPLFIYFHGGAFCIASSSYPKYHEFLNKIVAEANVIAMSVDYRLAPEFPLPIAYEDSWDVLKWVAAKCSNEDQIDDDHEPWIEDHVDFEKVYLAGDSAGANIAHHLSFRDSKLKEVNQKFKIHGIVAIHPYFWGSERIGVEVTDTVRRGLVDKWWDFVCPSDKGSDDPLINPFAKGSPSLVNMGSDRILVCLAEKDILRDRGRLFYEALLESGWHGSAEIVETEGEDHVFHIFDPNCEKAKCLFKSIASFINQNLLVSSGSCLITRSTEETRT